MFKRNRHGLTPKEQAFCDAYIKNGRNGKQAAIKAKFAPNSAPVTASRLLHKANVSNYLTKRFEKMRETAEKIGFTDEYVLQNLMSGVEFSMPSKEKVDAVMNADIEIQVKAARLSQFDVRAGVSCIAERNKMLGAYPKEEKDDSNDEIERAKIQEAVKEHEREY